MVFSSRNRQFKTFLEKHVFCQQLHTVQERLPKDDFMIMIADLNAKVGSHKIPPEHAMERCGLLIVTKMVEGLWISAASLVVHWSVEFHLTDIV